MKTFIVFLFAGVTMSCTQTKPAQQTNAHEGHSAPASRSYVDSVNNGLIAKDTLRGSPVRMAMAYVGNNHVHIEYGSPGVRGRTIWGGLVAYDEVWATGAHDATSVQFSRPVVIGETTVPKGKYGFFTIPGRDFWTLILNTRWEQHLADDYNSSEDVVRVMIRPTQNQHMTQRLTYTVIPRSEVDGEIVMEWEMLRVALPFRNKK